MKYLLHILLLIVIAGCSATDNRLSGKLDEAQALMTDDVTAALNALNAIDMTECSDSAIMARWALLYCQALSAGNITVPTDTIINYAMDYYGNHNQADLLSQALEVKSQMTSASGKDAIASALYMQKEKELMLYKERYTRRVFTLCGIFIVVLAACIIAWQRQRIRLQRANAETLLAEATWLREGILRTRTQCSALESKLAAALSGRFNLIDELCETYYETQGTKAERKAIVDKVKSQISSLRADEGLFADMENAVNVCNSGILQKLRDEFPQMKTDDYRMMVFLSAGLSNRSIALLIDESIEVIYKRKSRLKARINTSDTVHRDLFMSIF